MNDYSRRRVRPFHNVELQNVITMLQLVASLRLRKRSLVKTRFEERGHHFEETLRFLNDIGLVIDSEDALTIPDDSVSSLRWPPDAKTTRRIVEAILATNTPYRVQLSNFLAEFENDGEAVVYAPPVERRVKESAVRNFAITLGLVHFRRRSNDYAVQNSVVDLWIRTRVRQSPKTKVKLLRRLQKREELGFAAECAAMEFERKRLGKSLADRVHHTSKEHPLAPYDIESLTVTKGIENPRFIEVKAVSVELFRFFWSKLEFDTARFMGRSYFLYLVPVPPTRGIVISGRGDVETA